MVKLIFCISKKPGMSVEEFQAYWRGTHAPIAGAIPGLRRYVQSHVVPATYDGARAPAGARAPGFDGAAELWFDNMDALRAAMQSPEVRAALEDEKNFIDHTRVASFITEEHVVVSDGGGRDVVA